MEFSFYTFAWTFLIYSVRGWCTEVVFVALDTKQFDNRGYQRGPDCQIYGVGITLIVTCLEPFSSTRPVPARYALRPRHYAEKNISS